MATSSNPASYLSSNSAAINNLSLSSSAQATANSFTGSKTGIELGTINKVTTGYSPTFGVSNMSLSASGKDLLGSTGVTNASYEGVTYPSATSSVSGTSSASVSGSSESSLAGSAPAPRNLTLTPIDINSSLGVQLGSHASLFEVSFAGFPISLRRTSNSFINNSAGLLCHEASLPGTSFGTADIFGVYQQVSQKYAHSRIYPTISLTFYEDRSYKMITFFEDWQNHMTVTGTSSVNSSNYFYRMRYPSDYKCDTLFITKYERNYGISSGSAGGFSLFGFNIPSFSLGRNRGPLLQYQFLKVFPLNVSAIPVSYGDTDILKVTVEFSYDRYLMKNNGIGADDGVRPSQTTQEMPQTAAASAAAESAAPAAAPTERDDLAAWALSNKNMIKNQNVTSAGNYLQDQKDILANAQKNYPPGSPQLKALEAKYGFKYK